MLMGRINYFQCHRRRFESIIIRINVGHVFNELSAYFLGAKFDIPKNRMTNRFVEINNARF